MMDDPFMSQDMLGFEVQCTIMACRWESPVDMVLYSLKKEFSLATMDANSRKHIMLFFKY